jgi:hypothetical protein
MATALQSIRLHLAGHISSVSALMVLLFVL